ncbi:MAG TPA: hypothetical protein V6C84_00695 [Coleofasciculaceae cyanobacterium]|jgi:hypothetical protein
MPIDPQKLQRPLKPPTPPNSQPHSPHPDSATPVNQVQQQSQSAIATASQGIIGSAGQSLQKLDQQLSSFEDRYVASVHQRIAEVPARIEAKLAASLTWAQEGIDPLATVFEQIGAWQVEEFPIAEQFLFTGTTPIAELLPELNPSNPIK